jgi:hypothetical protein
MYAMAVSGKGERLPGITIQESIAGKFNHSPKPLEDPHNPQGSYFHDSHSRHFFHEGPNKIGDNGDHVAFCGSILQTEADHGYGDCKFRLTYEPHN